MNLIEPSSRRMLLVLIAIELLLIGVYRWNRSGTGHEFVSNPLFLAALGFGIVVVYYAYQLRCPNPQCRARQVFRGPSAFDIRLPATSCQKCGTNIS